MSGRWKASLSRLIPSCREAMGLFSRSLDRAPSWADRLIWAIHLLHCPACRRASRQIGLLVARLRRSADPAESGPAGPFPALPAEVREAIKKALRGE